MQFGASLVVAAQPQQRVGEVVAASPFFGLVAGAHGDVDRLPVEPDRLVQPPLPVVEQTKLGERRRLPGLIVLLHVEGEGVLVGLLGGLEPSRLLVHHADLMPGHSHRPGLAQRLEHLPGRGVAR